MRSLSDDGGVPAFVAHAQAQPYTGMYRGYKFLTPACLANVDGLTVSTVSMVSFSPIVSRHKKANKEQGNVRSQIMHTASGGVR